MRIKKKVAKRIEEEKEGEGFVSVEAFEIFHQRRDLESCGDLSWEDLLE